MINRVCQIRGSCADRSQIGRGVGLLIGGMLYIGFVDF